MRLGLWMVIVLVPCAVMASVPEPVVPAGGFFPLHQHGKKQARKGMALPSREARFIPLPPRGEARMIPIQVPMQAPFAQASHEAPEMAMPVGVATASSLSEENAKLLLSIFTGGY